MSNYSKTSLQLRGSTTNIKKCIEDIMKYTNTYNDLTAINLETYPNRAIYGSYSTIHISKEDGDFIEYDDNSIRISGQSVRCAPHSFIDDLVKKHKLSGILTDLVKSDYTFNVRVKVNYENGKIIREEQVNY